MTIVNPLLTQQLFTRACKSTQASSIPEKNCYRGSTLVRKSAKVSRMKCCTTLADILMTCYFVLQFCCWLMCLFTAGAVTSIWVPAQRQPIALQQTHHNKLYNRHTTTKHTTSSTSSKKQVQHKQPKLSSQATDKNETRNKQQPANRGTQKHPHASTSALNALLIVCWFVGLLLFSHIWFGWFGGLSLFVGYCLLVCWFVIVCWFVGLSLFVGLLVS